MENKDALNALMNIEGFRSLNTQIETIINKSEAVKKAKKRRRGQAHTKAEAGADRGRKENQNTAQADSGKAHQICYPCAYIHVSYGRA